VIRFIFIFLAVSGLLLVLFPQLDLAASNLVYNDDYFALSRSALAEWLKDKTSLVMLIAGLSILGYLAFALWQGDFAHRRKALYLLVAIALGPGLVTNVVSKTIGDGQDRAKSLSLVGKGSLRQRSSFPINARRTAHFIQGMLPLVSFGQVWLSSYGGATYLLSVLYWVGFLDY